MLVGPSLTRLQFVGAAMKLRSSRGMPKTYCDAGVRPSWEAMAEIRGNRGRGDDSASSPAAAEKELAPLRFPWMPFLARSSGLPHHTQAWRFTTTGTC